MRSPTYVDADLYRMLYGKTGALLELELDVSAADVDGCRCFDKDPEAYGCSVPYTFAHGAIRLSCTNGDRVVDYLTDEGYSSADDDLDLELLARLDRAAERERVAIAKADERIAAELRASVALTKAGWPMQALAAAGRALREATR